MSAGGPTAGAASGFDPAAFRALGGLDFQARYVVEGLLHGLHASPFHGFSVEFSEYRNYQPGDDLRHLDWRLYARNDRLYIKRFEQETNARVYLLCDTSASMGYQGRAAWGSKFEAARMLAAAMGWLLLRQGDAPGMLGFGAGGELCCLPPSQKAGQYGRLIGELERLSPVGGPRLEELLAQAGRQIKRRGVILLFTDLLEPSAALETALKRFRFQGHDCRVFQVLDADEVDFPFTDADVFEDIETGQRRQVRPDRARAKYLERFRAFMQAHYDLFARLEIPHAVFRTEADPAPALARFLSGLGKA